MEKQITCTITEYQSIKKRIRDYNLPVIISGKPKKAGKIVYVNLIGDEDSLNKCFNPPVSKSISKTDAKILISGCLTAWFFKMMQVALVCFICTILEKILNIQIPMFIMILLGIFLPLKIMIPQKALEISKKYSNFYNRNANK